MEIEQPSFFDRLSRRHLAVAGALGVIGIGMAINSINESDKSSINYGADSVSQACVGETDLGYVIDDDRYELCAVLDENNDTSELQQLVNNLPEGKISEATIYITDPELNRLATQRHRGYFDSPSDEIEAHTGVQEVTGLGNPQQYGWSKYVESDQRVNYLVLGD